MDTPICDFVRMYRDEKNLRLHMPGHKGNGFLGFEELDITEIDGADSLYEADGIIRKSEKNASKLFECDTFYSTEGSSQCIRAMLYLAMLYDKSKGRKTIIAAGRNVHKTFLSAVALLDLDVMWLYPCDEDNYLSCKISKESLEKFFIECQEKPTALYLTSPDYLGNVIDIKMVSEVCHKYGCLLLVDNAHGAYLRFLEENLHPVSQGADLCCASAHKTLPVLTGGAYLHISNKVSSFFSSQAKNALALFGSTSPSYLILQSLDSINPYLEAEYPKLLCEFVPKVEKLKNALKDYGYKVLNTEPLKLTLSPKEFGYTGIKLSEILRDKKIVCEFADKDYIVLMLTPEIKDEGIKKIEKALLSIERKAPVLEKSPKIHKCEQIMSVREAIFSNKEKLPVKKSKGRVLADASVGCPPAVPIIMCGERIDDKTIECFSYYGIEYCTVVK